MARPTDKAYRVAILGALDNKSSVTMSEINEHLKEVREYRSYHSTRRMVVKMEGEGLLHIDHKRGQKNSMIISKGIFSPYIKFTDLQGNSVNLRSFIRNIINSDFPEYVSAESEVWMISLMVDSLLAANPDAFVLYGSKVREVPNAADNLKKLKELRTATGKLHALLKHFIDSDIHSPVAKMKLKEEVKAMEPGVKEQLVRETWKGRYNLPVANETSNEAA